MGVAGIKLGYAVQVMEAAPWDEHPAPVPYSLFLLWVWHPKIPFVRVKPRVTQGWAPKSSLPSRFAIFLCLFRAATGMINRSLELESAGLVGASLGWLPTAAPGIPVTWTGSLGTSGGIASELMNGISSHGGDPEFLLFLMGSWHFGKADGSKWLPVLGKIFLRR